VDGSARLYLRRSDGKGFASLVLSPISNLILIFVQGYNKELNCFAQSYENNTMLDSSILIAPLVFFVAPNDPRFISTMERIMQTPEQGGLTSLGLVYRYDTTLSEDGTPLEISSYS
jgi:GH15 family glucan-1,4-alpha-glucosidase